MLFAILLLIIGFVQYHIFSASGAAKDDGPRPLPLTVSKHSPQFNQSIENVLTAYIRMTDGFANSDLAAIESSAGEVKISLDSLLLAELQTDSLIYETAVQPFSNAKSAVESLIAAKGLDEKRSTLNNLSGELYSLFRIVKYDLFKLYWKECLSGLGPDKPGYWLSKTEDTTNPYGIEKCAEIRSSINFVADTAR